MTREEAFKEFIGYTTYDIQPSVEATKMAIEALKREPCKDVISRQAAIDAMIKIEQDDIDQYGCKIPEGFDSRPAIEALNNLQSVRPKPETGWWRIDEKCPRCGCRSMLGLCLEHYCPNCGLKMVYPKRSRAGSEVESCKKNC